MPNLRSLVVAALPLLAACAGINAPSGMVPAVEQGGRDAFGGWVALWEKGSPQGPFQGELIALDHDSIYVLTSDKLVVRSVGVIQRARLVGYNPQAGQLGTWTLLGTLSTLSHGVVAVLSAPAWLLIGGIATSSAAHSSEINVPAYHRTWDDLRPYARFPQGLPPSVDRSALRMRSIPAKP